MQREAKTFIDKKQPPFPTQAPESLNDPVCDRDHEPCVPEGDYSASCISAKRYRNRRFKRDEFALTFVVLMGLYAGTKVKRYYCSQTAGRQRSNYLREWVIANQGVAPTRGDRLPYNKFVGKVFKIRIVTVLMDAYQQELPAALQYSKVSAIVELVTTNEKIN
jgi:hypothetical protein